MAEVPPGKLEGGRGAKGAAGKGRPPPAGVRSGGREGSDVPAGPMWDFLPDFRPARVVTEKQLLWLQEQDAAEALSWSVRLCVWLGIVSAKTGKLQGARRKLFHQTHKKTLEPSFLNALRFSLCQLFLWPCI